MSDSRLDESSAFDSDYEPFFQPPGWVIGPV